MSPETKAKLALAKIGKKLWPNGRIFSEETRKKMSLAKLGKPAPVRKITYTLEQREAASLKQIAYLSRVNPDYVHLLDSRTRPGNKRIRRKRIRENGGKHTLEEWKLLKQQHNFTCLVCLKQEPEIKLTRDHIIAISAGGTDNISNIQPLCNKCNASKSVSHIRY